MNGLKMRKNPNRMKKITEAITATMCVAIIRQLEMFSLLQWKKKEEEKMLNSVVCSAKLIEIH